MARGTAGSPTGSTRRARTAGIAQEMLLGIGGVRALRALGLPVEPLPLQRGPRRLRGHRADRRPHGGGRDLRRRRGRRRGSASSSPPTRRSPRATRCTRSPTCAASARAASWSDSEMREIGGDPFNMTVAGLRLARSANAVAQLHGETARAMWAHVDGRRARSSRSPTACTSAPGRTRAFPRRAPPTTASWACAGPSSGAPRRGRGAHGRPSRPRRPHDRLRAARRDLQAHRPHPPRPRSPRARCSRSGGCSSSSPARRTPTTTRARR